MIDPNSPFTYPASGNVGANPIIPSQSAATAKQKPNLGSRKKQMRRRKAARTYKPVNKEMTSVDARVEQWHLQPLRRLKGPHDGYAILTLSFPLYERYLRYHGFIGPNEDFTEGHRVFERISKDLSCGSEEAFIFWNRYRNGLLHRASQNIKGEISCAMVRKSEFCIRKEDNQVWINPFNIKNVVLRLAAESNDLWRDPQQPIDSETYVQSI